MTDNFPQKTLYLPPFLYFPQDKVRRIYHSQCIYRDPPTEEKFCGKNSMGAVHAPVTQKIRIGAASLQAIVKRLPRDPSRIFLRIERHSLLSLYF
jgi:hypothetical protein